MKIVLLFGIVSSMLVSSIIESRSCGPNRVIGNAVRSEWKAAEFKGLHLGSSSKKDVLKVLGTPDWEGLPEGSSEGSDFPEWWMEYDSVPELNSKGKLTVILDERREIVLGVIFYPLGLTKSEIVESFGEKFVITRYSFEPCDEEQGGVARLYESNQGQVMFLEYRSRGIAVSFDSLDAKSVRAVEYVSKPVGSVKSRCK